MTVITVITTINSLQNLCKTTTHIPELKEGHFMIDTSKYSFKPTKIFEPNQIILDTSNYIFNPAINFGHDQVIYVKASKSTNSFNLWLYDVIFCVLKY